MRGVARQNRDHGCQVRAGTVSTDGDAARVAAEFHCVQRHPFQRRLAVFHRRGEFGFRSQAIVDCDDDAIRLVGKHAADGIVGFHGPDHEAATV